MFSRAPARAASDLDQHRLRTYTWLRRSIVIATGVLFLGIIAYRGMNWAGGAKNPEKSISAYYYHDNHTWPMRDLFIGSLCAVGTMIVSYQGYRDGENIALNVAGFFLVCVAVFPMKPPSEAPTGNWAHDLRWVPLVHYGSALVFFLSCIYVVAFHAHDTLADISEKRRGLYKGAYRLTGALMALVVVGSLISAGIFWNKGDSEWLLWAEIAGIVAFWVFWIVKTIELENSDIDKKPEEEVRSKAPEGTAIY